MSLSRKLLLVWTCVILLTMGALFSLFLFRKEPLAAKTVSFPHSGDVESIAAMVFEVTGFSTALPEFVVPTEWMPKVLNAFAPIERDDYPRSWDREVLSRLTIKTWTGQTIIISIPFAGKN